MTIESYIDNLNQRYTLGNATEHTFRGDLQQLLETLLPEIRATNEPKRQSCGAPDYILTKKEIPIGFIEAKDIGDKDLLGKKKTGNKEQFDRYKASLSNLIFTDYIDFHIYQDGEFITKIAIAEVVDNQIKPLPENFANFKNLISDFTTHISQNIKSSKKLAEMMAGKARLLSDVIEKSLISDEDNLEDTTLKEQMHAFKDILIHDITPKGFADVYAQTIAYGLFAARLHDPTLNTFSRQEASELIPKSNPFLRKLFSYIAGADIDDRIKWIVDNLAEIFLACNVEEILKNYGKSTKMEDPIIHFYETFLAEYDPKLRKARGVWYTPAPVVNFIVRAVDDILKTEFDLPQGLADSSKTTVKVRTDIANKNFKSGYKEVDKEVHKVQVLDPATGTGTFLAEVIKHVHKKFKGQSGIWSSYAENNLLPRLNGFELLMASYAMAHLQIDLLLRETGFKATKNQRTKIYLTNSLEEHHPDTGTLFANWLSGEANEANHIKRDTPVMCIIGNPPYNAMSKNQGDWIISLMDDYKKEPGGKEKLKERNPKMINDDYVKFIRQSQHFIEKKGEGIIAFINPHGFLDSDTFRGMRWNLLKTFDKIYSIDLHGNVKKKLVDDNNKPDENVFDITQGVSINFFIKTSKSEKLAKVFYKSVIGKRNDKYNLLESKSLKSLKFKKIELKGNDFVFVPRNLEKINEYKKHISFKNLFTFSSTGMQTDKDKFCIQINNKEILNIHSDIQSMEDFEIREKYLLGKDSSSWNLKNAIKDIQKNLPLKSNFSKVLYRPFDIRYTYNTGNSNGFMGRPRADLIKHIDKKNNISLITIKNSRSNNLWNLIFTSKEICTKPTSITSLDANYIFPLYLYLDKTNQQTIEDQQERTPNLDLKIIDKIAKKIKLTFTNEKEQTKNTFAPIDILDYIYAVLHSPNYRDRYKEFLKIDFPRVPYPKDQATFWQLVKLGKEIREIHLLESAKVDDFITSYLGDGDNVITRKLTKTDIGYEPITETLGKLWINDTQYFNNVPLIAWEFFIGGYQPAQKWLKDRKGRTLGFEDIFHYQKIIVALTETHRIMQEIDTIEIE